MKTIRCAFFLMFALSSLLVFNQPAQAQDASSSSLTLDLEIRPRFEFRHGFKTPLAENDKPAAFTEQRSRLRLNYRSGDISTRLTLQDVRIWGNHPQIYKADPALFNVYEAWGEYRFAGNWLVRTGRQMLDYDNARILGNLDWAQQGRSHDALLLGYRGDWQADAVLTWNQSNIFEPAHLSGTFYNIPGNHKSMQFLWLHRKWDQTTLSLLLHNDGRQVAADSSTAWRQTSGFYATHRAGDITLRAEAYYQSGRDAMRNSVSAWMGHFEAQWRRYILGADYLSGTSRSSAGNNSFEPLYGTNHKFYGFMDYFHVGSAHRQPGNPHNTGVINLYQKAAFPAGEKTMLHLHLHQFMSPVTIYSGTGEAMDNWLGTEIDLMFVVRMSAQATLTGGYSQLFLTDSMRRIKGDYAAAGIQSWAWVMLSVHPRIFERN